MDLVIHQAVELGAARIIPRKHIDSLIDMKEEDVTSVSYTHLDVYKRQQWNELKKNPMIELPDYPFNDSYEVALCTVNSLSLIHI